MPVELRPVGWRFALAMTALLGFYVGMFFVLGHSGRFDTDFYGWGLVGATVAPPLTAGVLAALGRRWWENDVGMNMIILGLAACPENAGLAWTFLFHHGVLNTAVLAWIVIGGPWWVVLASAWRLGIIGRMWRQEKDHQEKVSQDAAA